MAELVGQRFKRVEDPRLITGTGQYVDDVQLPGMTYAAILRSDHAHARIRAIDVSAARQAPGVLAVITGEDIRDRIGVLPVAAQPAPDMHIPAHQALAVDKVYFVGHPVAVVVAETRYQARDALDLVEVDYEPLPAVTDTETALDPDTPVIHEEFGTNLAFKWSLEGGDVHRAFEEAEVVVRQRMENQRLLPVPMEGRGAVASYYPGERLLTVWVSTQIPHLVRMLMAGMLGLPENRVRIIAPDVGGGFGQKLNIYVEEVLLGHLAMRLGRPVKWSETRRENFMTGIHGRGQVGAIELALTREGTFTGVRYTIFADIGAYYQVDTAAIPTLTGLMLTGSYRIPAMAVDMTAVFTNKMATDAYRGAGRPEATYILERVIDLAARELGMDPLELRRRNFIPRDAFPYATPHQIIYDSGDYEAALDRALQIFDYPGFRREQEQARAQGRYLGVGFSTYVEICGMGPSSALPVGGWESATIRLEPSGEATVFTGASPHGQGQETSFTQLVADELGVSPDQVLVVHGDTDKVQFGIGTFGSRGTAVGGTAVYLALQQLKSKVARIAAHLLETGVDDVAPGNGGFSRRSDPSRTISLQAVTAAAYDPKNFPAGEEPGLVATSFFHPENFTYPFGTHICVVEVDPETGAVKIVRYVAVDDCGRVINPMLVEGQIIGGIAQALGQAMMENCVYDEGGQLISGELMDYAIPRALDVPRIEMDRTETPTPVNPMGVKGVGEAGTIGATPAIANAVLDALAPFGVRHLDLPLTPARVWRAIQQAQAGSPSGPRRELP